MRKNEGGEIKIEVPIKAIEEIKRLHQNPEAVIQRAIYKTIMKLANLQPRNNPTRQYGVNVRINYDNITEAKKLAERYGVSIQDVINLAVRKALENKLVEKAYNTIKVVIKKA